LARINHEIQKNLFIKRSLGYDATDYAAIASTCCASTTSSCRATTTPTGAR